MNWKPRINISGIKVQGFVKKSSGIKVPKLMRHCMNGFTSFVEEVENPISTHPRVDLVVGEESREVASEEGHKVGVCLAIITSFSQIFYPLGGCEVANNCPLVLIPMLYCLRINDGVGWTNRHCHRRISSSPVDRTHMSVECNCDHHWCEDDEGFNHVQQLIETEV